MKDLRFVLAIGVCVALGLAASAAPPGRGSTATAAPQVGAAPAATTAVSTAKWVYLTFDDGPSAKYTAQILRILQAYHVRATFFEVGQNVKRYPALTRRVDQLGHSVQNHSWSHPNLTKANWSTFKYQVRTTDRYLRAQTGYTPRCLRPPYGATNRVVAKRAAMLGKKIQLWSVDPADWSRPGTSVIVRRVLSKVHTGSVILMHDGGGNRSQTVAALPTILKTLKARGYLFYPLWCQ
ncbi:polysaccharide deacetylase family protein [Kribbella sp. NPDC051952]|uniref:polysaccharide deacetylase family protein n=1 Tax=Kribbella sp. NPDC051952 TaxID=3154851 RepID=UPI003419973A